MKRSWTKKVIMLFLGIITLAAIMMFVFTGSNTVSDSFPALESIIFQLPLPQEASFSEMILKTICLIMISAVIVILKECHIVRGPPVIQLKGYP